ncbi:MAG: hypothetical protein CMJ40_03120 [Phycisphaerae bacterium]|nr:hypothetical protein [Phycisphaerae bacterium]|tara:strand:+ start:1508 stop:2494 length:987 start_codon:yes stop_codon:yes gene_type:complete
MKNIFQALAFTTVAATTAVADTYQYCYEVPDFDRWMYPWNGTPGTRIAGPTFTGYGSGVDDRYGQSLFGWVTIDIPTDLPAHAYTIVSMSVEASISNDNVILDETEDARSTHDDPESDLDPGRPFHLSGVGFRGDYDANTFGDDAPFGSPDRNAYALGFTPDGEAIDISNNLTEQFDPKFFAVATSDSAEPGEFLPELARMRFDVDVADEYISCYVSESLSFGLLDVMITSLHTGTHSGGSYPQWIMAEHPLVELVPDTGATLCIEVEISYSGVSGDTNGDGLVNIEDLLKALDEFGECDKCSCASDFNSDSQINVDDVLVVISGWTG